MCCNACARFAVWLPFNKSASISIESECSSFGTLIPSRQARTVLVLTLQNLAMSLTSNFCSVIFFNFVAMSIFFVIKKGVLSRLPNSFKRGIFYGFRYLLDTRARFDRASALYTLFAALRLHHLVIFSPARSRRACLIR